MRTDSKRMPNTLYGSCPSVSLQRWVMTQLRNAGANTNAVSAARPKGINRIIRGDGLLCRRRQRAHRTQRCPSRPTVRDHNAHARRHPMVNHRTMSISRGETLAMATYATS